MVANIPSGGTKGIARMEPASASPQQRLRRAQIPPVLAIAPRMILERPKPGARVLRKLWFHGIPQKGPSDAGAVGNIARLLPIAKMPATILRIPPAIGFQVFFI